MASKEWEKAKETASIANVSNLKQYEFDVKQYQAEQANLQRQVDMENEFTEQTYAYQQELRNMERLSAMDKYDKSQEMYKQQLVWNELAATNAMQSQNEVYNQRVAEIEQAKQDQAIALERTADAAGYNVDQAEFTLEQALHNSDAQLDQAKLERKNQALAIGQEEDNITKAKEMLAIQQTRLSNQERDAVADRNFAQLEAQIQNIQAVGQERARGRKGRSTRASTRSAVAALAFNTAKISDALYRSKQSLDTQRSELAAEATDLGRRTDRLSTRSSLVAEAFKQTTKDIEAKRGFAERRKQMDVEKIAKDLDIDLEVFQLNQERLGEQLVSAATARELAMGELAKQKMQADVQADAVRMLPIRMAPDPPRPFKAEMPAMVPPPEPVRIPPKANFVPGPKKQSGLSKVLSIGAAAVGIAGAAFTGGASLGLTMGMASTSAAAGLGIGLTAASGAAAAGSKFTY